MPRRKWIQVSWKRVALLLGLVLLCMHLVLPISSFFEPWYFAHSAAGMDQNLNAIPQALPNAPNAPLISPRIERFETSFQIPWSGIEMEKDAPGYALFHFKNGPALMFFKPNAGISAGRMRGRNPQEETKLRKLFGARALSSDYDWEKTVLSATPDQIEWWNPVANQRAALLLGLKNMELTGPLTVYNISNAELHGFQIGDPASPTGQVRVKLYDVNGRTYEFWLAGRSSPGKPATQSEINAFISSLKPIPHS